MTKCATRLLRGNLGHGHRLFLPHQSPWTNAGQDWNFQRTWAPLVHTNSGEIHMDQSLVHTFSWGNSYGPMVLKGFLKFPPALVLVNGWLFPAIEIAVVQIAAISQIASGFNLKLKGIWATASGPPNMITQAQALLVDGHAGSNGGLERSDYHRAVRTKTRSWFHGVSASAHKLLPSKLFFEIILSGNPKNYRN